MVSVFTCHLVFLFWMPILKHIYIYIFFLAIVIRKIEVEYNICAILILRSAVVRTQSAGPSIKWTGVQIHSPPSRSLGNFVHPTLPVSFRRDAKSRWSLLPSVYARGSKMSHTGGKCVGCRRLTNDKIFSKLKVAVN